MRHPLEKKIYVFYIKCCTCRLLLLPLGNDLEVIYLDINVGPQSHVIVSSVPNRGQKSK